MMGKGAQQGAVLSVDFGYAQQSAYHGCWVCTEPGLTGSGPSARLLKVPDGVNDACMAQDSPQQWQGFVGGFCAPCLAHRPGFGTVQAAHMNSMRL